MKTRTGLVSNSSSSSFILAVADPDKLKILKFLLDKYQIDEGHAHWPIGVRRLEKRVETIADLISAIDLELDALCKDRLFLEKEKAYLDSIERNNIAKKAILAWIELHTTDVPNGPPEEYRARYGRGSRYYDSNTQKFINLSERKAAGIQKIDENITHLAKLKEQATSLPPDAVVMLIEADQTERDEVREVIELLQGVTLRENYG